MPTSDLTPMERALLRTVEDLAVSLTEKADRQDRKIAALEQQIALRDRSISDLARLLEALLGPPDPSAYSPP